jgi:hypothetical protein
MKYASKLNLMGGYSTKTVAAAMYVQHRRQRSNKADAPAL